MPDTKYPDSAQFNTTDFDQSLIPFQKVFEGEWTLGPISKETLPMISENFELNEGEVILEIESLANLTTIIITLQEGKYIDERIQISLTTMERLAQVIRRPKEA